MIFFTADTHFGHRNIINLCKRPFASIEEMDETLTRNWNAAVSKRDEIYILGDLTMKPADTAHGYLSRLNGRKYLIRGNHDRFLNDYVPYNRDIEWVKDYHTFKRDGRIFVLFHYPIAEWYGFHRGAVHLHGHVHNREPANGGRGGLALNVGVDCNEFRPVSIETVLGTVEAREASNDDLRTSRRFESRRISERRSALSRERVEDEREKEKDDDIERGKIQIQQKNLRADARGRQKRSREPVQISTRQKRTHDYLRVP
jgi:calcineurin-like phosphoesterase family protein